MNPVGSQQRNASVLFALNRVLGDARRPVSLHEPRFSGREWDYVKECLDTGWVSSVGRYVDRLERDLEQYTGCAHAVVVASGTAALQVAYRLAGVQPGDEILMPALTFVATANAAAHLGATPHFVDSHAVHLGVDAQRLGPYLESLLERRGNAWFNRNTGARVAALATMHVFGLMGDVEELHRVCGQFSIPLIEDAAEALGSRRNGKHAGNTGLMSTLSFNGNKVVTTGGGGAILTHDAELARRAKHLTTTARQPHAWDYFHDEVGYNFRMPNINAAVGCAQLEALPELLRDKAQLAWAYERAFRGVAGVRFLGAPAGNETNHWLNALVLQDAAPADRDDLLAALHGAGIMVRPVWKLMHHLPMYADCPRMELREAEKLERCIINVPSSAFLSQHLPSDLRGERHANE